jgi:hypothetical protein
MRLRLLVPVLSTLLLVVPAGARRATAGAWSLAPGDWYSEFRAGVFTADSWHDENGTRSGLFGGGLVQQRSLISYNELGWKKHTSVVLAVPAQSLTRRDGIGRLDRTETGLGDATVGFRYRLANAASAFAIELDWKAPLGYNRHLLATHQDSIRCGDASGNGDSLRQDCLRQTVAPRLGEGQQDVSLLLRAGYAFVPLRAYVDLSGGYRYRFDAPADQIVGGAEVGFWLTRMLMVGGRYQGEIAAGSGNLPIDEIDRHLVGPLLIYRVDDNLDVQVSSMHTASAKNAYHTDEIFVGVAFKQTRLNRLQGLLGGTRAP